MMSETTPASPATQVPQLVTTITLDPIATGQPATIATPGQPTETILYTGTNTPVPGNPTLFQPANPPRQQSDTAGNLQTMDYSTSGDLIRTSTNTGVVTTYTYDEIGRRLTETVTAPTATTTSTYTYNQLGQTATETASRVRNTVTGQWHQARTTTTYDANTNPIQVSIADIEPAANGFTPDATRTTTAEFDLNDRNWRSTDPEGNITSVTFDDVGNQITQTDALGRITQTIYDSEYRPVQVIAKAFVDPTNPTTPRDITVSTTTYDGVGRVDTETDAAGNVTKYTYAADGQTTTKQLIGFVPRTGSPLNVTVEAYTYDEAGRIKTEATANGTRLVTNTYDTSGRLATQTLTNTVVGFVSPNRTTSYTYDAAGRVTATDITDGTTTLQTRTGYDAYGRATTQTIENGANDLVTTTHYNELSQTDWTQDPNGNTTYTEYDLAGHPIKTTRPAVAAVTYGQTPTTLAPTSYIGYDTFGEATHYKDPAGNVTTVTYDRDGRQTGTQQPAYTPPGASTPITPTETIHYDPVGNIDYRTDRRGQRTDFTYDTLNRQAIQTDPAANAGDPRGVTQTRYDDLGNITWTQTPTGAITTHTYDKLGRTRTTTETVRNATATPDQYTTTFDYDWAGNQTLLIDPTGTTTQTAVYSPAGNQLAVTDALGKTTVTTYNPAGLLLTTTDPEGRSTRNTYDQAGRTLTTGRYNSAGTKVVGQTFGYDNNGNQTAVTDNLNHTTNYTYDALNRLTSVIQPVNATTNITTSYGYDTRDLQTRMTDGNGHDWWTTYNTWGLEESRIEPDPTSPAIYTKSYDAAGTLIREQQPGGVTITHTIDNLGRDTADDGGTTGGTRGFVYDLAGRPTTVTSGTTNITLTYNDREQLTATTGSAGTSGFTYDPAGRMTHRVDAAGDTAYAWTARGQLASLADPITGSTHTYTYSNAGDLTADTITNGVNTLSRTYTYTSIGQPATDTLTNGATVTLSTAYTYDPNGNLQTKTITPASALGAGTNSYTYDWAARLNSWTPPTGPAVTYAYDNNGNLTQNGVTANTYNWRNQQLTNGTTTNTWTQRGTLASTTTGGVTTNYTFDGLNRMTAAAGIGYTYDGLDRMNGRNGITFTYSGTALRPASDGVSTLSSSADGTPVATNQSGSSVSIATDRHGDVTATFGTGGALMDSVVYDPWGNVQGRTGPTQHTVGFQSGYTDLATGLTKMGARWYQPSGEFQSEDTHPGQSRTPVTENRYAYGLDNPLNIVDPTGYSGNSLDAAIGLVAHRLIENRYLSKYAGSKAERAYRYPGYRGHSPLRVDLVDPSRQYYYEIKPNSISGRASGASQLRMREVDRLRPWTYKTDDHWTLLKGKAQFNESIYEDLGPATLHLVTHKDVDGLIVYDKEFSSRDRTWGGQDLTDTLLRVLLNQYSAWLAGNRRGPKPQPPTPPPSAAPHGAPEPKGSPVSAPTPDPALVRNVSVGAILVGVGAICLQYCWVFVL